VRVRFTRPSGTSFAKVYYDELIRRAAKWNCLDEFAMSSARAVGA